jgi:hypothetical protein
VDPDVQRGDAPAQDVRALEGPPFGCVVAASAVRSGSGELGVDVAAQAVLARGPTTERLGELGQVADGVVGPFADAEILRVKAARGIGRPGA